MGIPGNSQTMVPKTQFLFHSNAQQWDS